jgi:hypothetical protein
LKKKARSGNKPNAPFLAAGSPSFFDACPESTSPHRVQRLCSGWRHSQVRMTVCPKLAFQWHGHFGASQLTIHLTPNLSVTIPNDSAQ